MSLETFFCPVMTKLKSRKLWATIGAIGLATYELHTGHLTSSDWVSVLKIVLPIWLVGEVAQKAIVGRLIASSGPRPKGGDDSP
jgi:hypothetical protein